MLKLLSLPTECVCVFHMVLIIDSDCFLWGSCWILIYIGRNLICPVSGVSDRTCVAILCDFHQLNEGNTKVEHSSRSTPTLVLLQVVSIQGCLTLLSPVISIHLHLH
jgi:hypothetical protein